MERTGLLVGERYLMGELRSGSCVPKDPDAPELHHPMRRGQEGLSTGLLDGEGPRNAKRP